MFEKNTATQNTLIFWLLVCVAYLFSLAVRMYWPMYFSGNASMYHAGQLMINTNDGYCYATGARDFIEGITKFNPQRALVYETSPGLVMLTAYIEQFTPFSLETVILYLPAVISSLIVIPIIFSARLIGHTFVGFLAALIASIAWSYYNRTMTGYYDTDMFSVLFQYSIFYGFLRVIYYKNIASILFTACLIFIYPYFYFQGVSIVYAIYIISGVYLILEYLGFIHNTTSKHSADKNNDFAFMMIVSLGIALMSTLPVLLRIVLLMATLLFFKQKKLEVKYQIYMAIICFIGFLYFGNVVHVILAKIMGYLSRGVDAEGLHFYQVIQTVREAGSIPMTTVANRISGSSLGLLLSLIGYILLVVRHKLFIVALPLIGVGLFSYVGGLRFTVYAVPIAALSVVYLFYVLGNFFQDRRIKYAVILIATLGMLYPNIIHIIEYKVPTVLNSSEVEDLEKLKSISTSNDYTIAWWDYGYPIWFYSNTNTIIDGARHTRDNFVVSTILQTNSQNLAANLSRIAIEAYVDSNYSGVTQTLFPQEKKNIDDPNIRLSEIENGIYPMPKKTRDVYLYLPYRMLNIFPTVALFGNIDLTTGKMKRKMTFYPTSLIRNDRGILTFRNGIVFDARNGTLSMGKQKVSVKYYIVAQHTKTGEVTLQTQLYDVAGEYAIVYLKSYGGFVVMDTKTLHSTYVQMFMLGKYNKDLFELVVSSPYSKIYRLKI